ncbi:MAG: low molecular weight protein arginine phosphatase [Anaerolineae bacterium]|nr:low molecular weight protein arginine phosphatase [Anaerolineae bacterium]
MAEGLLRKQLAEMGLDSRHRTASAGVWGLEGRPAAEHAVTVMKERGIDIRDHVAQTIRAEHVAEADLILVMSREHETMIRNTWPQYGWKVYRLSEMAGKRKDVEDPYGQPIGAYRASADIISLYLERGLDRILELI